jgi:hypothetical protein
MRQWMGAVHTPFLEKDGMCNLVNRVIVQLVVVAVVDVMVIVEMIAVEVVVGGWWWFVLFLYSVHGVVRCEFDQWKGVKWQLFLLQSN